jgi:hypothetical protein
MFVTIRGGLIQVDECDLPLLAAHSWRVANTNKRAGDYRYVVSGRNPLLLLHRMIVGAERGRVVDHVNGDRLDNRRSNLRMCSHAENMRNRKPHKNNTSGFPGVRRAGAKWRAEIYVDGAVVHLGLFDDANRAADVYRAASRRLHGEFSPYRLAA